MRQSGSFCQISSPQILVELDAQLLHLVDIGCHQIGSLQLWVGGGVLFKSCDKTNYMGSVVSLLGQYVKW